MDKHYKRTGDGKELTHTSMGKVRGAWSIPKDDYNTFLKLYKRFGKKNVGAYVERSPNIAPFYFDIDFHTQRSNRYYDDEFVKETISRINNIVKSYFDVDETSDVFNAYVFEKYEPTEGKENDYKDGFHIMYPEMILDIPSRYFVYDKFMEILGKDNYVSKIPHTNDLSEIFDKSVIEANGVLMYGCAKDGRDPYKLTRVYNHAIKKILPEDIDSDSEDDSISTKSSKSSASHKQNSRDYDEIMDWNDLIDLTSMRLHEDEPSHLLKPITNKVQAKIQEIYENKYYKKTKQKDTSESKETTTNTKTTKKKRSDNITDRDIRLARELTKILSKKRATDYESWRNVCWALHNVDDSLYDAFIDFSKKAGKDKFDEKACKKFWEGAKNEGYSIGSLRLWAHSDDQEEFDRIISDVNQEILSRLASCSHDDVANYIHMMYKGQYACTDIEKQEWYEFKEHRWHRSQKANSLYERISSDIANKITCAMSEVHRLNKIKEEEKSKIIPTEQEFRTSVMRNSKSLIDKLKDVPYKENIMKACRHKFFDPKFKEKLNSNMHLICFNNGVYNLNKDELGFRDGVPEDYISFSVGYDYIERPDTNILKQIHDFFKSCLPIDAVRKYVLRFISSCLDGTSKDQKFPFWIGTGGNGKSVTINMCQYAFGDYYSNMSIAYLTKPREGSSNASPDLADKVGKRIITFQEAAKNQKIQGDKLKELCGNDTISARALYQEQMYFKPQAKYILATNKLPELDIDGGLRRRLRVVKWAMKFCDPEDFDPNNKYHALKDYTIDERTKTEEWKQNFMWMLINEIYPEYLKDGLCEPKEVTERSSDYMASNDRLGNFLNKCTENTSTKQRSMLGVIYQEFEEFYKLRYSGKAPNYDTFIEYLRSRDYRVEEKGKNNVYVYGLKIREEEQDDGGAEEDEEDE